MEIRIPFTRPSIWSALDVSGDQLEESESESRAWSDQVEEEIRWKEDVRHSRSENHERVEIEPLEQSGTIEALPSSPAVIINASPYSREVSNASTPIPRARETRPISDILPPPYPLPSFRHSLIAQTSTPQAGPSTSTTFPSITTPSFNQTVLPPRPGLRALQLRPDARPLTPAHIDSPTDTPGSVRSVVGEGRGRRDDPATPVPLGVEKYTSLRAKKDFQTLTKHFELFSKQSAKLRATEDSKQAGPPRGRAKVPSTETVPGLGGKVFEGLRFCFPPQLGNTSKQRSHWDIPDTAITHVIYDSGRSAQMLARQLGLNTLSELPEGTLCVKYNWIVACLKEPLTIHNGQRFSEVVATECHVPSPCMSDGKLVNTEPFLSFPSNVFTRSTSANTSSRLAEMSTLLRTKSTSINRKRGPTASESDTESPEKQRFSIPRRPLSTTVFPTLKKTRSAVEPSIATSHELPKGPGWVDPHGSDRDGLDEMIMGVKNSGVTGNADEDLSEDDTAADVALKRNVQAGDNPSSVADAFKCGQDQDGTPSQGPNEWLAKKFDEMHDMYQGTQHKNQFSIQGYRKAAGAMRRAKEPIRSRDDALRIKGIGQSMADRIGEWLSGAQGREFYENTDQVRAVQLFKDIYGVGRTRANELYHKGARTIEDLRSGKFDLTEGQKIGLTLLDDLKTRIPREECFAIYEAVRGETLAIDKEIEIEIMGSYRRGAADSGDVDFLITRDDGDGQNHSGVLQKLVKALMHKGIITHELSAPSDWTGLEVKWMGVCRLSPNHIHRRIDILCIPFDQWGAALIYFTGNDIFNRSLRLYARKMGYSLNQRGLSTDVIRDKKGLKLTEGRIIASRTEKEIFDVLGIRWRPPHLRRP